jgi:CRP/FNR family transcriptional regulator, cyclic AMP receptor protein
MIPSKAGRQADLLLDKQQFLSTYFATSIGLNRFWTQDLARKRLMNTTNPNPQNPEVNGLITAISRNKEDGTLSRFLGAQSWYIVADYLYPHQVDGGHVLISQGGQDRKLYFLESGSVKVDVKTDAGFIQLAILGPGTVVGEGSFFSHLSRNASVTAYSDCKVWELNPGDFDMLSKRHPTVALNLAMALGAILASRMHDVSRRISVT